MGTKVPWSERKVPVPVSWSWR